MLTAGELAAAEREFVAARELEPAGRWTQYYAGVCAYRSGRLDDAVASFSVCIGAAPEAAGCYYNRALAYEGGGHDAHALRDYDIALRLDPNDADAALARGRLYWRLGNVDAALRDARHALACDPAHEPSKRFLETLRP